MKSVKKLFFFICAILMCSTTVYAWSSADNFQYGFATHQFLNQKAYKAIRSHPAFNSSGFPSLDDIQRHGGVTIVPGLGVIGLGPDKEGNSKFSQHWYNPANKQGKAPETIQELHDDLIQLTNQPVEKSSEKELMEKKAHSAAYVAHYIQDMTCPMHVSGMSGLKARKTEVGTLDDISPYAVSKYSKETWETMIDRYRKVWIKDRDTDFFDPLYYDGSWPATTKFGSHVQYEAKVEENYMAVSAATHKILWAVEEKKGYILDGYDQDKNKPGRNYMASLAKEAAKKTRDRIGTKSNPGPLWVDLDAIFSSLQIPYEDWWRAVQLTYVTWRSTFCALHLAVDDIKFVKVPNQPGKYKISVSVDNLEPEAPATNVTVEYEISGDIKTKGIIKLSKSIEKYELSEWYSSDKSFEIDDPKKLSGKIVLKIKGEYDKSIPDSGFKQVEYNIEDIMVKAIAMPDVVGFKKDSAIQNFLGAFNVTIEPAGKPETMDMEYRIKSQKPAYGEWVAPEENVVLTVYDKYLSPSDQNDEGNDEASNDEGNPNPGDTQNNPPATEEPTQDVENLCKAFENELTSFSVNVQTMEKEMRLIEDNLNKFFSKSQEIKKDSTFIKTGHKQIEKKAAKVAEIAHELEKLALKVCETTNGLNDHTISDSEHNRNYDWINNNKESLKEPLNSAKSFLKDAIGLQEENKKQVDEIKILKDTLQAAFQKLEKDFQNLQKKYLDGNKRLNELGQRAEAIPVSECSQQVLEAFNRAQKSDQKNQEKLAQATGSYEILKIDFDKKVKAVENLDQTYQKTAYLIDLSKTYVERAQAAAVKGAFCAVLADGIMERVFIPDVTGIEISTAELMVSRKGLTVNTSEIGPAPLEGEAGRVKEVTPGITKRVKKGTVVTLSYYDERPDRDTLLANKDCSQWPGSQAVWDIPSDKPVCDCPGNMVWNQENTKCISKIDAALANANCPYSNSYPVWNADNNRAECACLTGTDWNKDNSACIDSKQAVLENMNCSQYPGTIPGYDNNGNPMCVCPGGLPWIRDLNRCATQQDIAMANVDCSPFPGTVPGWDSQNNKGTCECPYGTQWDSGMGRCIDKQELAIANTDCSHLPGSVPVWSYITNRPECECKSPYSRDPKTGKCVDLMAQLAQNQRDFDEQMANNRKRNQEQQQQFFNNMMGLFTQPSNPGGNNTNSGREICGDGIDNNGNNQIDEGCNYSREIILDDSECPDDTMELIIDGRSYGTNPAGHVRHFNITGLTYGSHKLELYGVKSGGDAFQYFKGPRKGEKCSNTAAITYSIEFGSGVNIKSKKSKHSGTLSEGKSKYFTIYVQ